MGILDAITGASKQRSTGGRPVVVITPLGEQKLEKPGIPEYQWKILDHLKESGACNMHDLAEGVSMSESKVLALCRDMARDGFVRKVGSDGSSGSEG